MENQTSSSVPSNLYPTLKIDLIANPNRMWAIPVLGGLAKMIILIPVALWLFVIGLALFVVLIINSLMVLFTGKYWDTCYSLLLGYLRLTAKTHFFMLGLTNKYPGFDLQIHDSFSLDMPKPENPNRLFAFPVLGGLARMILLIPYFIYMQVLQYGMGIASVVASFPVLFTGKFPESLYEFERDTVRVHLATTAYLGGFSDKYPSWWISMNHKAVKIVLIVIGALLMLMNWFNHPSKRYDSNMYNQNPYMYQYDSNMMPMDGTMPQNLDLEVMDDSMMMPTQPQQ